MTGIVSFFFIALLLGICPCFPGKPCFRLKGYLNDMYFLNEFLPQVIEWNMSALLPAKAETQWRVPFLLVKCDDVVFFSCTSHCLVAFESKCHDGGFDFFLKC